MALPDDVLVEIFNQCQQVARQTWQTGRRLIEAVETLFPDQPQILEHIAGLVSRPAYRFQPASDPRWPPLRYGLSPATGGPFDDGRPEYF